MTVRREGFAVGCWGVRLPEEDAGDWEASSPGATVLGRRATRHEYASVRTDDWSRNKRTT